MSDFYRQHAGPELQAAADLAGQGAGISAQVTSADDEAYVTELATSLVVLIATWRERAKCSAGNHIGPSINRCAAELEAVLRSAT